jgi:arylsulfatase A-like enzyme
MPASGPYRDAALRGIASPSLPGGRTLRIRLPRQRPETARFETMVGLLPQYDRHGAKVRFHARLEEQPGLSWVDETVVGSGKEAGGEWLPIRRIVELPPAGDAHLLLEVEGPDAISSGAMWANPTLSWGSAAATELNLLVVLIDTLRRDVLGAYGDGTGITPRLDELGARSVRIEHLFAPASWTLPSVASLMTGLHPQTHGAGRPVEGYAPTGLIDSSLTLAEVLADAGFFTVGIYNNIYLNTAFGMQQGFDRYTIFEERAEVLVDAALAELEEANGRRLFLFLHLFDPHNPYEPPPNDCEAVSRRLFRDYDGDLGCEVDRRPHLPLPAKVDRPWIEALYRGEVAYTDHQVGRLLDGLAELGLAERTVILVVSDHGEEFWHRQSQEEAYGYRVDGDHGHTLYGELVEVPGILHVPGLGQGVLGSAVEMVDLFPTLLSLLDVPAPVTQGRDLAGALEGPAPTAPVLLFDLMLYGRPRWAVQRGADKLVVPHDGTGPVELFDLRLDPGETRNLAAEQPNLVLDLRRVGERELRAREAARKTYLEGESVGATYLEWRHVTRLRALGYLK